MKLTAKILRQIIREELEKIAESRDPKDKLMQDMTVLGPFGGMLFNKLRKQPEKAEEPRQPRRYMSRSEREKEAAQKELEDARFERELAAIRQRMKPPPPSAQEIASELRSSNLIANVLDNMTIRVKLKDQSGKTINKDFLASQGAQSIIDQIMQEFPNAMMQASKRGMRTGGDMVDIQDPMMERKNKKRRAKNA